MGLFFPERPLSALEPPDALDPLDAS